MTSYSRENEILTRNFSIDWCAKAYTDLLQLWSFAPNLEQIEEACMEVAYFCFGEVGHYRLSALIECNYCPLFTLTDRRIFPSQACTKEQMDEIIGYWMQNWPPYRRTHLLDVAALISGVSVALPFILPSSPRTIRIPHSHLYIRCDVRLDRRSFSLHASGLARCQSGFCLSTWESVWVPFTLT